MQQVLASVQAVLPLVPYDPTYLMMLEVPVTHRDALDFGRSL